MSAIDTAWNGEGLPPVGTVCLILQHKVPPHEVEITAIGKLGICVLWNGGEAETYLPLNTEFRRTTKQIAAEARVKAAQEWLKGIEREYGEKVAGQCEDILMEAESRKKVMP